MFRAAVNRSQHAPHSGKGKGCGCLSSIILLPDRKCHLFGPRAERKVYRWMFREASCPRAPKYYCDSNIWSPANTHAAGKRVPACPAWLTKAPHCPHRSPARGRLGVRSPWVTWTACQWRTRGWKERPISRSFRHASGFSAVLMEHLARSHNAK